MNSRIDILLHNLEKNTSALYGKLSDLDDSMLVLKPHHKAWNLGEIFEHIVLSEKGIKNILEKKLARKEVGKNQLWEEAKLEFLMKRSVQYPAAEIVKPKGLWIKHRDLLKSFQMNRFEIQNYISQPEIYQSTKAFGHDLLGDMTYIDWVNFMMYHANRHVRQMNEVLKQVPSYSTKTQNVKAKY